jgi:hypothetical protein
MLRLLTVVLVASLWLPGCLTYSAIQKLADPDHAPKHVVPALVIGNVLAGAAVGGVAASESAPGDRGITFVQGMAAWNMLDLFVGFPLAMLSVFREKLDE